LLIVGIKYLRWAVVSYFKSMSISQPANRLPWLKAATPVVPAPTNGSQMRSLGRVKWLTRSIMPLSDWSHIVRIMNTQKAATVTIKDKNDQKIFIRKCTCPESKVTEIYNALGYKHYPFVKKSVLPEMVDRKIQSPGTG